MRKIVGIALLVLSACATYRPPPAMREGVTLESSVQSGLVTQNTFTEKIDAPHFTFAWECVGNCGGTGGWKEITRNTVLTGGGNDLLDKYFKGSSYSATWYLALKHTGTIAAADVWTSHAGWTEATPYSGNRPAITWGTTAARSNTATQVSISINATDADVKGACISSVNTGTSGILYACTDFAAARSVVSGDTLNVTPTVTD